MPIYRPRAGCRACGGRFAQGSVEIAKTVRVEGEHRKCVEEADGVGTVCSAATLIPRSSERVIARVLALGEHEIPSARGRRDGDAGALRLDKVAYIRFASVHRSFQDVSAFRDALTEGEAPLMSTLKSTWWRATSHGCTSAELKR